MGPSQSFVCACAAVLRAGVTKTHARTRLIQSQACPAAFCLRLQSTHLCLWHHSRIFHRVSDTIFMGCSIQPGCHDVFKIHDDGSLDAHGDEVHGNAGYGHVGQKLTVPGTARVRSGACPAVLCHAVP